MRYSFDIIDWKILGVKKIDTKTRKLLNMHNMLHPKVDVERLYIPRKDGERGLIDVKTAFKTVTIGLDHYLKHKEGQYPKKVLEHEQSKTKNSITKNATNKFKRELSMLEIESREDNSLRKCYSPETQVQVQDEINERRKVEKQSIAWSYRHSHHQHTVIK